MAGDDRDGDPRPGAVDRGPDRGDDRRSDRVKRVLDVVLAAVGLVLLAPVFAVVAWRVRRELGSPVLFTQQRPGQHGQIFTLRKFRTMTDERGPDGQLLPDEQRLTAFGRFLRSSSLDELPELVNVLRGEMSLVGPRPLLVAYLERYSPTQARRHEVRPGITGWAQINGRNDMPWDDKLAMDVWYVDHRSLRLDLKILLTTLWVTATRRGVSLAGHATTVPFQGSGEASPAEPARRAPVDGSRPGSHPDPVREGHGPLSSDHAARRTDVVRDERGSDRPFAVRRDDGVIACSCGDRLADRIDGDNVVIDGVEFQFRRRNDHMTCRTCGASHPMREFRTGVPAPRDTGQRRRADD